MGSKKSAFDHPDLFAEFFNVFDEFENDLSFTDFQGESDEPVEVPDRIQFIKNNADQYLSREMKITNLAKAHFDRFVRQFSLSDAEEKIYHVKLTDTDTMYQICQKIAKRVFKPLLQGIKTEGDACIKQLISLVSPFKVTLTIPLATNTPNVMSKLSRKHLSDEKILKLTISEKGYEPLVIFGLQQESLPKKYSNVLLKDDIRVADLSMVFSALYVVKMVSEVVRMTPSEEDVVYHAYQKVLSQYSESFNKGLLGRWDIRYPFAQHEFVVDASRNILVREFKPAVMRAFAAKGIHVQYLPSKSELNKYMTIGFADPPALSSFSIHRGLEQFFIPLVLNDLRELVYHDVIDISSSGHWWGSINNRKYGIHSVVAKTFLAVWEQKRQQLNSLKYYKELSEGYARSYQTKRNIPQKTIAAMEGSPLNSYFGFVEFDEEADLEKLEVITNEFIAIRETYLSFIDGKNVAVRFRRLGNHKASGLYYPSVRSLCVDIHSPSSMIHEFGHMIDFEYGSLSGEFSFKGIRDLYEKAIQEEMKSNSSLKTQLISRTKYNLSYYLEPTEIFARCFELYLVKVKGVSNSLVPVSFGWEYPQNEGIMEHITFYFDNLLASIALQKRLSA